MKRTPDNIQIVTAYEVVGLSPEEIADDLGYDVAAVKVVLATNSALYRQELANNKGQQKEFTQEDTDAAKRVIRELMEESESDAVRYRTSRYILDVNSGRLNTVVPQANVSITFINQRMRNAREALSIARARVIDVPDEARAILEGRSLAEMEISR